MGAGTFKDGIFNLILSVRHHANPTRLMEWKLAFERASELLHHATGGAHRIGKVVIVNDEKGESEADAFLEQDPGVSASAYFGLGTKNAHMTLCSDERFRPFVIVHELGHFAYDLRDEYDYSTKEARCDSTPYSACIMDASWEEGDRMGDYGMGGPFQEGTIRQFCNNMIHSPSTNSYQQQEHKEDCLTTIGRLRGPLSTIDYHAPSFEDAIGEQRFVACVDVSKEMTKDQIDATSFALLGWVPRIESGDVFGVCTFGDAASTVLPAEPMDSARAERAADEISLIQQLDVSPNLGAGLMTALEMITKGEKRGSNHVVALVTSGKHVNGANPNLDEVGTKFVEDQVRINAIAVCPAADLDATAGLAHMTGGDVTHVDPGLEFVKMASAIEAAIVRTSMAESDDTGEIPVGYEYTPREGPVATALVEEYSEMATFVIVPEGKEPVVDFSLRSPSGQTINTKYEGPGIKVISPTDQVRAYEILRPETGIWRLTVGRDPQSRVGMILPFAFSRNRRISGAFSASPRRVGPRDPVLLRLRVWSGLPIAGISVQGVAWTPDGQALNLAFSDSGHGKSGDMIAGDGMYHARFDETHAPGLYTFEVKVASDGKSVRYAPGGERSSKDEIPSQTPIPRFERVFRTTAYVKSK